MDNDLEARVKKLEDLIVKITAIAKTHPMGKMFLDMVGLD